MNDGDARAGCGGGSVLRHAATRLAAGVGGGGAAAASEPNEIGVASMTMLASLA